MRFPNSFSPRSRNISYSRRVALALALLTSAASGTLGAEPLVLEECDSPAQWVSNKPTASARTAPDAKFGGAIKVTMPGEVTRTLGKGWVPGSAAWDRYEGVSFWVKGDGSDQFGCLALVGPYSYAVHFPLKSTEWKQYTFPWAAFTPEVQALPLGTETGMPVSGVNAIRLGSRWTITHNNNSVPAHSWCLDRVQLEEEVAPLPPVPPPRPFQEVLDLLKMRKPVRIQCMGDSITAGTSLPDRETQRYAVLTQDLLRRWLGQPALECYSRAVGGARTTDQRAWVPRDYVGPAPDLVTLWIGYNDKSGATSREYYKYSVGDYLDRVTRATGGKTAFLLFATGPGCGARFVMMDDYAEAIREIGRERKLPILDMNKLLKALGREKIEEYFADQAHPNEKGHRFIADALCEFLVRQAGIDTPKPAASAEPSTPSPKTAAANATRWDFEPGLGGWTLDSSELSLSEEKASSGRKALRLALTTAGKDHRRAFSTAFPGAGGQRVKVSANYFHVSGEGSYGLFLAAYDTADGSGTIKVVPVKRSPFTAGSWSKVEGVAELPAGVKSYRVMLWSAREAVATYFVDDVSVEVLP